MNDLTTLERRLALAEELLNILDAMRPDLPAAELHELGLQLFSGIADYRAGSLWIYEDSRYRSAAWYGMAPQRATAMQGAILDDLLFQNFLGQLESCGGLHWQRWPLTPHAPKPLQAGLWRLTTSAL